MFYLTTHSTHFIYGYMASDIWLKTILIVRKETHCRHIGYSFRLTARFFYMHHPTDRIAHTTAFVTPVVVHWLERGNSSMGLPHEGSIRRPIAPRANALTTELHLAPGDFGDLLLSVYTEPTNWLASSEVDPVELLSVGGPQLVQEHAHHALPLLAGQERPLLLDPREAVLLVKNELPHPAAVFGLHLLLQTQLFSSSQQATNKIYLN